MPEEPSSPNRTAVLMIGLDATDAEVVRNFAARGWLPNLAKLIEHGRFARLESPAASYAGGVWPTFYTGSDVPLHGVFHSKLWRPETMRVEVPDRSWLSARPLWEQFSDESLQVCAIDVPMVLGEPAEVCGVTVNGWGTHDLIRRGSWPPDLWGTLERKLGKPQMTPEHFGKQSARSLSALKPMLNRVTRQQRDVALHLLNSRPWRFGCVVFGATHRAGHYLWDDSQVPLTGESSEQIGETLQADLIDVYNAVDAAVGDLLAAVPNDTLVIAFSAHGMGPNPGWSDLFADILASIERHSTGKAPPTGLLYRIKQWLPHRWVRPVVSRLPTFLSESLTRLWSSGMYDWSQTRYFPVPMDEQGYIRINLQGRETRGIVTTAEYDEVCNDLTRVLRGLRDSATGETIVGNIRYAYRDAAPDAAAKPLLPDLIVQFRGPRAAQCRRLICTELPEFHYAVPERLPSGRSGNHTDGAWLVARGPGVTPGEVSEQCAVSDIMPTVLNYLGATSNLGVEGRLIPLWSTHDIQ